MAGKTHGSDTAVLDSEQILCTLAIYFWYSLSHPGVRVALQTVRLTEEHGLLSYGLCSDA